MEVGDVYMTLTDLQAAVQRNLNDFYVRDSRKDPGGSKELKYSRLTYWCRYGGRVHNDARTSMKHTQCPAHVKVEEDGRRFQVTEVNLVHNHTGPTVPRMQWRGSVKEEIILLLHSDGEASRKEMAQYASIKMGRPVTERQIKHLKEEEAKLQPKQFPAVRIADAVKRMQSTLKKQQEP